MSSSNLSASQDSGQKVEVRASRQRFAIRGEDEAQQLGEIALDRTVISRPGGVPRMSMQRVEVEALTETHEQLQSLAGAAPNLAPTVVDASMTVVEAALANLRRYLSDWHLHEPGARLGDDPEELHDLRVAGRKLDAILRQFRSYVPEPLLRI